MNNAHIKRSATAEELVKGREYWENERLKILAAQELVIDNMIEAYGLPDDNDSREFCAAHHLAMVSQFKEWIDQNFPL